MTVICTKPTTPESRKRHAEIFGEKPDRYCKECGRLPSFCECAHTFYGYTCRRCNNPARPEQLVAVDGEHEHRGECPTYVMAVYK